MINWKFKACERMVLPRTSMTTPPGAKGIPRGLGRIKPFGAVDDFGGVNKRGVLPSESFANAREPAASVLDTHSSRPERRFQFITARSRGQRPLRPPSTNRRRQAVDILAAERAPVPISTQQTSERRGGCTRGRVPSCLKLDPSHLRKMGDLAHVPDACAVCVTSPGPRSACLLAWRLTRRICGRCAAWRTLLTHAFCVPSFGPFVGRGTFGSVWPSMSKVQSRYVEEPFARKL